MRINALACWLIIVALSGCAAPSFSTRFRRVGIEGATPPPASGVAVADAVAVYNNTSPKGFSLAENELTVEEGYDHKIMGFVEVWYKDGTCEAGDGTNYSRTTIIRALKERAFQEGGNSVIYADAQITEDLGDDCDHYLEFKKRGVWQRPWGHGWVVFVAKSSATGTPPAPTPAPAPQ